LRVDAALAGLEELLELLELDAEVPPVVVPDVLDEVLAEEAALAEDEALEEDAAAAPAPIGSPESVLLPPPPHALRNAAPADVPARRKK
jgi:hypothetical protein